LRCSSANASAAAFASASARAASRSACLTSAAASSSRLARAASSCHHHHHHIVDISMCQRRYHCQQQRTFSFSACLRFSSACFLASLAALSAFAFASAAAIPTQHFSHHSPKQSSRSRCFTFFDLFLFKSCIFGSFGRRLLLSFSFFGSLFCHSFQRLMQ
jgi:hypothetical protein